MMTSSTSRHGRYGLLLAAIFWLGLLAMPAVAQIGVTIVDGSADAGEFELGISSVNYSFEVEGTVFGGSASAYYIIFATGFDIYGNRFYQELAQGFTETLAGPTDESDAQRQNFSGLWAPSDRTFLNLFPLRRSGNIQSEFEIVFQLYQTRPADDTAFLRFGERRAQGDIFFKFRSDDGPDMQILGMKYNSGVYQGGDVITMTTQWRNRVFPLGPGEPHIVHNILTDNGSYDGQNADDYRLAEYVMAGDRPIRGMGDPRPIVADGSSIVRKVEVTDTPVRLNTWGIRNLASTTPGTLYRPSMRLYQPQPDDGWLDIGETVAVTVEVLVPNNFPGTYFAGARIDVENNIQEGSFGKVYVNSGLFLEIFRDAEGTPAVPNNNTWIGNASAKITIDGPTPAPWTDAVSAIAFQDGRFVQGGGQTSDAPSVSDDGNRIVFSSFARNLRVPPQIGQAVVDEFGRAVDMSSPEVLESTVGAPVGPYLTANSQVFLQLRETREVVLLSANSSADAGENYADADCFNPATSADGSTVVFDSKASNLDPRANTQGSSLIYAVDPADLGKPVIVSRNAAGELADGDCYDPAISASGRFVVFVSNARNLDPSVTMPSGYTHTQIYLHDRNVDGRVDDEGQPVFDVPGNIATYLVSVDSDGQPASLQSSMAAINANDSAADLAANSGMYVAFSSLATLNDAALGKPAEADQVYRVQVRVTGDEADRGAVPGSVELISVNNDGAWANRPAGATFGSIQPSINGDGTQIAFTSAANNLVRNEVTGAYDADTNGVPDIFVRDLQAGRTVRVSESDDRVATGMIVFTPYPLFSTPWTAPTGPWLRNPQPGGDPLANIPYNDPLAPTSTPVPADGDSITIRFGPNPGDERTFVFRSIPAGPFDVGIGPTVDVLFPPPVDILRGQDVLTTRENLVNAINAADIPVRAVATTPPTSPGRMAYNAAIYLRHDTPGEIGNHPIQVVSSVIAANGMSGGGRQAEDNPEAVQGAPAGSDQPSIDRSGRVVAFRSIAGNLDVFRRAPENIYPDSPRGGELIRPLLFPASNVYLHNRQADPDIPGFDQPENRLTQRVSVSRFGYPTTVTTQQTTGEGAFTTAANLSPAISGSGRYIAFSSGAEGIGGLVFGRNNQSPLDLVNARDVYLADLKTVGVRPPPSNTRPEVDLVSPPDGLRVVPGTTLPISATASAKFGKRIASVQLYVNGVAVGEPLAQEPFSWLHLLPTSGQYSIRVVATDSRGIIAADSVTVLAQALDEGEEASVVNITKPGDPRQFVVGSQLVFNIDAEAFGGATIDPASVQLYINGAPIPTSPSSAYPGQYSATYTPQGPGQVLVSAAATDSNGNTFLSQPVELTFVQGSRQLPRIEILPLPPGTVPVANGLVRLSAEVELYGVDPAEAAVEFYADGVWVGDGTLQADGTYLCEWRTPEDPASFANIRARVIAPNFTVEDVIYYSSVFSQNFISLTTLSGTPPSILIAVPADGSTASVDRPLTVRAVPASPGGVSTAVVTAPGANYTAAPLVEFDATNGGIEAQGVATCGVQRIAVTSGGSGYSSVNPPRVVFTGGGGSGAAAEVVIDDATGRITAVNLTRPGAAYTSAPVVSFAGGVGSGARAETFLQVTSIAITSRGVGYLAAPTIHIANAPGDVTGGGATAVCTVTPAAGVTQVRLTSSGSRDYVSAPSVTIAPPPGQPAGSEFQATATATCSIASISVTNGGSGYSSANPPQVEFTGGGGTGVQAQAVVDDAAGSIQRVDILYPGTGYTALPTISFTGGAEGGAGAAASARLMLSKITVDQSGSGYISDPAVTLSGGGATAQATAAANVLVPAIDFVQFYVNGVPLGAPVEQEPFEIPFTPTAQGSYLISVVATSESGLVSEPDTVLVTVPGGLAPIVTLTSPLNGSYFIPGSTIVLAADAFPTAPGASIRSVQFFVNGVSVGAGRDETSPFTEIFDLEGAGSYAITAVATDNFGNVGIDRIDVTGRNANGREPRLTLTQPRPELNFVYGSSLFLNLEAIDDGGAIDTTSPTFYLNGNALPAEGRYGAEYGKITYSTVFLPIPQNAEVDMIGAATDLEGNTAVTDPTRITFKQSIARFPTITMLPLIPGTATQAGGTIPLRARAFFPPEANAEARVDFFVNGVFVGTQSQPIASDPQVYAFNWDAPESEIIEVGVTNGGSGYSTAPNVVISAPDLALGAGGVQAVGYSEITGSVTTIQVTNGGSGYTVAPEVQFEVFTGGKAARAFASVKDGKVDKITLLEGGSGYTSAPRVQLVGGNGQGATASAGITGVVTGVYLNEPGRGYTRPPTVTFTGGGGTGAVAQALIPPVSYQVRARALAVNDPTPPTWYSSVISDNFITVNTSTDPVPTVSIRAPNDGALVTVGQPFRIQATAAATGTTVARVEFYVNGSFIGFDDTAPYEYAPPAQVGPDGETEATTPGFVPPSTGDYTIVAVAVSATGVQGQSTPITVSAALGAKPEVALTGPKKAPAGSNVRFDVAAFDADGTIRNIDLIVNGQVDQTIDGTVTPPPYFFRLFVASEGLYQVMARATDNLGNISDSNRIDLNVGDFEPGSPEAFVIDMFQAILSRQPTDEEFSDWLNQLAAGYEPAQLVYDLLYSPEYLDWQNHLLDFYYRLNVAPVRNTYEANLAIVANANNQTLLPVTNYGAEFNLIPPGQPFGATAGQALAAQSIIDSLDFRQANPELDASDQSKFLVWLWGRLGTTFFGPVPELVNYVPWQGGNTAFFTGFYNNAYGFSSQMEADAEKYQFQLRATSVQWLLGGPWQAPTDPVVESGPELLAFIQSLLDSLNAEDPVLQTFQLWGQVNGLIPAVSVPTANPSGDGITNLLKYAFNLDPNVYFGVGTRDLVDGGQAGLPAVYEDNDGMLTIQFVRRKANAASVINYEPQFSSALDGAWEEAPAELAVVTPIDEEWERVTIKDSAPAASFQRRFGRVRVTLIE